MSGGGVIGLGLLLVGGIVVWYAWSKHPATGQPATQGYADGDPGL